MLGGFHLAFFRLGHRQRRVERAVDEFRDVAFAHEPRQIALHLRKLLALFGCQHVLDRGLSLDGRRGSLDVEEFLPELAHLYHRMHFDERNQRTDAVREHLAGHPEFPLHGAHIAHALRAFLEYRQMLAP